MFDKLKEIGVKRFGVSSVVLVIRLEECLKQVSTPVSDSEIHLP